MRIFLDDNTQREFQLPAKFAMELSRTNPFLTDEGSQSVPLTLPPTDHNLRLVGALHRGVWTKRPVRRLLVRAQHGAVNMRGSLAIDSAHRKDGIGCTFYTSEGQLYETIGEKLLGDLEWPVKTISGGVTARIAELKQALNDVENYDYWIFPALSNNEISRSNLEREGMKFILNEFVSTGTNPPADIFFVGEKTRDWVSGSGDDKLTITLPIGYGLSPFLKISYLLRFIFSQFGYNLRTNMFDTETSLKQLALINNTADAICDNGTLYYRQLVPEKVSIMDFLNVIRRKFGIEFVDNGQDIVIRQWNQAIDDLPDKDLSSYTNDDLQIDFQDPKALLISMNRSLTPYAEVEGNGPEDLVKKYGEAYLDRATGRYYTPEEDGKYTRRKYVSSSFWDRVNPTTHSSETIEMSDNSVPSTVVTGTVVDYGSTSPDQFYVPFIGGIRNVNSYVSISDNSVPDEEEKTDMPIMLCFSAPRFRYGTNRNNRTKMGSSFKYGKPLDNPWGTMSLIVTGESNLYDLFYRHRDDMLQHANQIVKFEARLLPEEIVALDLSVPKIVNGIKILIERIDYILGRPDICQVTARTLHEFED